MGKRAGSPTSQEVPIRPLRTAPLFLTLLLPAAARADDWPQWRGPNRDGVSAEKGWLDGWPEGKKPKVAWRAQVGKGHAAVSVAGGRAYTVGWDGTRDTVFCLDADTGKVLWKQSYPCAGIKQWPGPRATPTVAGGAVYTLGQHGQLHAWDAATGKPRWQVKLAASYNPDVDYGFAWSPLAADGLLILAAGSKGLAVRAADGTFAWGDDGRHGACASPVPFTHAGRRGVALITTNPGRNAVSLVGVEPRSGEVLWKYADWPETWGAACVDLLVKGGKVFVTTAESHQRCARFSVAGKTLKQDWSNNRLAAYTGGCVLLDGHIYAVNRRGLLKCLSWETGEEKWAQRDFGEHGSLTAAGGLLLVQASDGGELVVVRADPKGYRELRRARVFDGPPATFTAPVPSNGRVYCRSYAGEVVCLDLRAGGRP